MEKELEETKKALKSERSRAEAHRRYRDQEKEEHEKVQTILKEAIAEERRNHAETKEKFRDLKNHIGCPDVVGCKICNRCIYQIFYDHIQGELDQRNKERGL